MQELSSPGKLAKFESAEERERRLRFEIGRSLWTCPKEEFLQTLQQVNKQLVERGMFPLYSLEVEDWYQANSLHNSPKGNLHPLLEAITHLPFLKKLK